MQTPTTKWISIAILLAAQALAQQPNNAALSGRVTDTSGKPIPKATLLLISGGRSQNGGGPAIQPYHATTAADGSYSFANIEPGAYNLQAYRAGYASAIKGGTDFHEVQGTFRIAAGQQITGIDFALALAATISGVVTDADGDPVADAQIGLWRTYPQPDGTSAYMRPNQYNGPVTSDALTDNNGKYSIENVAPGTYYLSAGAVIGAPTISLFDIQGLSVSRSSELRMSPRPNERPEGYLTTWFPRAIDPSQASPIEVAAARNIQLQKTSLYQVKGKLVPYPSAPPLSQTRVGLLSKAGQGINTIGAFINTGTDGLFEMNGLPPGDYYVQASEYVPNSGTQHVLARQQITIANRDIDGLTLNLLQPALISGAVTIDGKQTNAGLTPFDLGQPPHVGVTLVPAELRQGTSASAPVQSDGSFSLTGVMPGAYRVTAYGPRGTYVKSVRVGGVEVQNTMLNLPSGSSNMQIALGTAGSIRANIQAAANGAMADYVIVVPAASTPGVDWKFQNYEMAGDGDYVSIPNLPPGSYRLYALAPLDKMNFDPAILKRYESQSVPVTVSGGEQSTTTIGTIPATGGIK
jgi:protocatechuate 3,4-dioxygenase beta subunit